MPSKFRVSIARAAVRSGGESDLEGMVIARQPQRGPTCCFDIALGVEKAKTRGNYVGRPRISTSTATKTFRGTPAFSFLCELQALRSALVWREPSTLCA